MAFRLAMVRGLFLTSGALGLTIRASPELWALQRTAEERLGPYEALGGSKLLVALGAVPEARDLVADAEVENLASDAFILRSRNMNRVHLVVCAGRTVRAVGYSFFEFLRVLGFSFLHPLKPVAPRALSLHPVDLHESPRWEFRGTHYHTQHPLELTNCLNGYDEEGKTENRERWAIALKSWEDYLDWLLAQKQNYVEWILLADARGERAKPSEPFELSSERFERLQILVSAAHAKGLEVGADVPLFLQQQHSLNLLPNSGDYEAEVRRRVQWLRAIGFDHLGTELGSTEFTRGLPATETIRLLNIIQEELGSSKLLVKNHCSSNLRADGFTDPRPHRWKEPLNFNYLNYFANPKIVSMPHTVQAYSLTDPAPTYGNANFSDLRNWTSFLLQQGRPVVFYPETAYWVNYDISVPLFLAPIYTLDRIEDANTIDSMPGSVLTGQLNFESGWQWGYWLANSAQALVAWRRVTDTKDAFQHLLHFLGKKTAEDLADLLGEYASEQKRLLIRGVRQGGVQTIPAPGTGLGSATGIAYLQGSEGLSDFASLLSRYMGEGAPAPDRLQLMELYSEKPPMTLRVLRALLQGTSKVDDHELHRQRLQWFQEHLHPLLTETNATFHTLAKRFEQFRSAESQVIEDLAASARMLSLRASQVLALYEYAACGQSSDEWCKGKLGKLALAKEALRAAQVLAREQVEHMGLRNHRSVLEWREAVPTAYRYGYLWAADKLFYWHRDQEMVEKGIDDVCFRTINDPIELGLSGGGGSLAHWARSLVRSFASNHLWHLKLSECLGPPVEPKQGRPESHPSRHHLFVAPFRVRGHQRRSLSCQAVPEHPRSGTCTTQKTKRCILTQSHRYLDSTVIIAVTIRAMRSARARSTFNLNR